MKVLMFGWEFPPHIAGGLGTACHGLTKGLAKHDVEILFVMPSLYFSYLRSIRAVVVIKTTFTVIETVNVPIISFLVFSDFCNCLLCC